MASFGIGAKLRQARVGKGLAIDDIARDTRIAPRFLEAIETDDFSILPGLIFTRNFVRQYALILHLDPDPLLAELPKQDETTAPLPDPPAHSRSSYNRDRRLRALQSSIVWIVLAAGAGLGAYLYFNRSPRAAAAKSQPPPAPAPAVRPPIHIAAAQQPATQPANQAESNGAPVQVSLSANERAWVRVSVDGKTTFMGTLTPNETKAVSAAAQVQVLTGNAGALSISLNGKTLESLGRHGEVREVRLTAEGPQFLSKAPPPAPDPL